MILAILTTAVVAFQPIALICTGGGSANKVDVANAHGPDGITQVTGMRTQGFGDQVRVEIADVTTGKLMVPRTMLPPIHGGKNGWFEINKMVVTETEITGSVSLNFTQSPKVRIDRLTGFLSIAGNVGNFSAECEPYDPEAVKRKF